jgi:hypothetical protein
MPSKQIKHTQTTADAATNTNLAVLLGILVGTSIQQKLHAVRVTIGSGTNQRNLSVLRARLANAPSPPPSKYHRMQNIHVTHFKHAS